MDDIQPPEDIAVYAFALGEVEEALEIVRRMPPTAARDAAPHGEIETRLVEAVRLMRGEE